MSETTHIREALQRWLRRRLPGAEDLCVSQPRKPGAGESSDTQLFEIDFERQGVAQHIDAVLRGAPRQEGPFPEYDLGMQFHVMKALAEAKVVAVPEVLWLEEDPGPLGVPFFVMRAVPGDAPLDRPSYHAEGFYYEATPVRRRVRFRS